jgi:putative transposase
MRQWPHAPLHSFDHQGTYMITAGTHHKNLYFKANEDLELLHDQLLELAEKYGWHLKAWAVFANHYHFLANSPSDPSNLRKFITHLHSSSARLLNKRHKTPGRQVWYQYWDKRITFESSYLARLNYIIQNPVKHHLVATASLYPWCSASWFENNVSKAYYTTVTNTKIDKVEEIDDFF